MLATQVILCVTIIGNVALFTVALREKPSLIRGVFAFYIASVTSWTFFIFLNLFLRNLLVEQCVFATAATTLTTQVLFAQLFPQEVRTSKIWIYTSLAIGAFFIQASFYPGALFHSIALHPRGYTIHDNGYLSPAYSIFALCYVSIPIFIFYLKYRFARSEALREQLRYLTAGFILFAGIAMLTTSVLPIFFHVYELNAIGPSFSLVFATCVFYIIAKHEFLDIRSAIQRGVIYSFLISIIIAVYWVLIVFADRDFSLDSDLPVQVSAAVAVMFGVLTIPIVEGYFRKMTDRIFFKDRYDYASALESLSKILTESIGFSDLIAELERSLAKILRAESVHISLSKNDTGATSRYAALSPGLLGPATLMQSITVDGKTIGTIVVGPKLSGDRYRPEDARLLRTCSLQASTALARAQLFLQVEKHASELEQKVVERTAELELAHEREQHMMQDIAHSLQTPLAIFRTQLEQLRSSRQDPAINVLDRSLMSLSGFIGNLLQLAHLEHGRSGKQHALYSLSDQLNDICDEIAVIAAPKHISIERNLAANVWVRADEKELRGAIMNLASNALKYMRAEGQRMIQFVLSEEAKEAVITVSDTGRGIPAENIQHLFERFYRADAHEMGGGLGLAISKKIIDQHGGSMAIQSTLGHGTAVSIRIPCSERSRDLP